MTDLVENGRFGALADAEQRALVLAAVGTAAHLIPDAGMVRLCVPSSEALRAHHELGCYARENARWRRPRFTTRAVLHRVEGALACSAVLLFFLAAQRRHALSIDWLAAGAANAGRIGVRPVPRVGAGGVLRAGRPAPFAPLCLRHDRAAPRSRRPDRRLRGGRGDLAPVRRVHRRASLPAAGHAHPADRAGYMTNAWMRVRHPDYDELRHILNTIGETIRVRAH